MPLLFLNEKSCGTGCDPMSADHAMTEFAKAVVAVLREDRSGTVLVSDVPLTSLAIAEGYPIGKWIGNPRNRDYWQRLRLMQSKSPFRSVFPDGEDWLDVEYRHSGLRVGGLGGAHLMDGLGVSLPVDACWDATVLQLDCEQLVELPNGELAEQTDEVEVRHLSAERHVEEHRSWIKSTLGAAVLSGAHLWEKRSDLFPHLRFLARVEADLRGLPQVWVGPVRRRLAELEEAVAEWHTDRGPEGPQWRSWVTGEHQQRRMACWFADPGEESQLYDTHARFTPDEGRIHFRVISDDGTVCIGYLGRKLGI
ncbi:hypothetical protein ACIGXA_39790 [Streptomyces fildesensis]|uniref:Uncharacterized protein n=1 Tax=Streptomyces fildesensis TaxID=375757 RepID=A0ABW8CJM9_9ACTN